LEELKEEARETDAAIVNRRAQKQKILDENRKLAAILAGKEEKAQKARLQMSDFERVNVELENTVKHRYLAMQDEVEHALVTLHNTELEKEEAEEEYAQFRLGFADLEEARDKNKHDYEYWHERATKAAILVSELSDKQRGMKEEAEAKRLKMVRMKRENQFLRRHLELRRGVSSVYYELKIGDMLEIEADPAFENMAVREMIMKYDLSFRKCFTRYQEVSPTNNQPTGALSLKGFLHFCTESQLISQPKRPPMAGNPFSPPLAGSFKEPKIPVRQRGPSPSRKPGSPRMPPSPTREKTGGSRSNPHLKPSIYYL